MKKYSFPPFQTALDEAVPLFKHPVPADERAFYNDVVWAISCYADMQAGKPQKYEYLKSKYDDLLHQVRLLDQSDSRIDKFKNIVHAWGRLITHYKDRMQSETDMKTTQATAASPKTYKHEASGKKFFEVEFGHGGTFLAGDSVDSVGRNFANKMDCEVRPAKMTPSGLVGVGKFKKFKKALVKKSTKTKAKTPYLAHSSTMAVASEKLWVAKSPKGGNVTDAVASKALEKYMEAFGKRGNLSLYEAEHSNGMLTFTRGCRMFKGSLKEIIAQLQAEAIAASEVIAEDVTVPNKVAGQIYGDIKAISSKLKSWKKSMTSDEYKLYESYQKSVLKAVMAEWVPKLSKEYQEKIKSI